MRLLIALIISLLFTGSALAQDGCWQEARNLAIMGGGTLAGSGGATCDVALNHLGTRDASVDATSTLSGDSVRCNLRAPDCAGKLYTAYLHHRTTGVDNAKVCIYTDDGDSAPDSADTLLVCSGVIAGSATATYYNAAMASNPDVATGTNYWVCIISDPSTGWDTYNTQEGQSQKYQAIAGSYASPPANLAGTWGNNSNSTQAVFVTVGD